MILQKNVMQKILITGGAGLIGSHLTESLVWGGHDVTVLDDLSRGQEKNLPKGCTHFKDKVENINELNLGRFDIVIHLATFMYGLGFGEKNHQKLYDRNILINQSMVRYLSENPPTRCVFISSSCVYPDDGVDIVDEDTPLGPLPEVANIGYGFAKKHMEDCLRMAERLHGFELCIVRPLNIYGERYQWAGEFSNAIPMLVNKVMTQPHVIVWGSGEQRRNYVHAMDAAEIVRLVSLSPTRIPLINIGNELTVSLNLLTQKIAAAADKIIEIYNDLSKPEGRFIKSCKDDLLFSHFPDFKYSIPLDEGLKRMITWWRKEVQPADHANVL
jgi:nucleoside-diphosphate-sugar epimerase